MAAHREHGALGKDDLDLLGVAIRGCLVRPFEEAEHEVTHLLGLFARGKLRGGEFAAHVQHNRGADVGRQLIEVDERQIGSQRRIRHRPAE
ncbi:MAG: hypothetical protein NVSMB25_04600 [Thermoleophilaceae bacterium]